MVSVDVKHHVYETGPCGNRFQLRDWEEAGIWRDKSWTRVMEWGGGDEEGEVGMMWGGGDLSG